MAPDTGGARQGEGRACRRGAPRVRRCSLQAFPGTDRLTPLCRGAGAGRPWGASHSLVAPTLGPTSPLRGRGGVGGVGVWGAVSRQQPSVSLGGDSFPSMKSSRPRSLTHPRKEGLLPASPLRMSWEHRGPAGPRPRPPIHPALKAAQQSPFAPTFACWAVRRRLLNRLPSLRVVWVWREATHSPPRPLPGAVRTRGRPRLSQVLRIKGKNHSAGGSLRSPPTP